MFQRNCLYRLWRCGQFRGSFSGLSRVQQRLIFSQSGHWEQVFSVDIAKDIEKHWLDAILRKPPENAGGEKFYVLSMFPYPSGQLHMGHVRVYTISDVMARFHRLTGKQVIHPMGWDAFGLPAENAARDRGEAPDRWTYSNIRHMKQQLKELGCLFDWDREFATCDPAYYRWTQYIFLRMYRAGLAYQKEAEVNWDPVDQTVLADEQIDEDGRSWRSGVKVEKRFLRQWYLKTTVYAKSLLDGLETVNPKLWRDVVKLQRHWLGDCTGSQFDFKLLHGRKELHDRLSVFTPHPELIYGASFIAVRPSHRLNQPEYHQKDLVLSDHKDVLLDVVAIHPFTGQPVPVIVSQNAQYEEGQDEHLGISCANEEDDRLGKQFNLPLQHVLQEKAREMVLSNSGQFSGLSRPEAVRAITRYAREHGFGGHMISSKLKDWLISRQRYWGTPIPIIHCPKCRAVPVPEADLPVTLPEVSSFHDNKVTPLSEAEHWKRTTCPKCGGPASRETDTMDTFVDSSWYYLRYLDPNNSTEPFDTDTINRAMPVDVYIGGKEHAVLHLYFARFFCHFLAGEGLLAHREPFRDLLTQGMVMGQSYQLQGSGRYLRPDQVTVTGETAVEKETGAPVVVQWEKMSKSKYNGVNPQDVLNEFGMDSTRLCILSDVAPKYERHWSDKAFVGITNWQKKIWTLMSDYLEARCHGDHSNSQFDPEDTKLFEEEIFDSRNYHIREITHYLGRTYTLNTAIAKLQSYTRDLRKDSYTIGQKANSALYEQALADCIIMLSPFAPAFACELWTALTSRPSLSNLYNWKADVFSQTWPQVDLHYKIPLMIKVNGVPCLTLKFPRGQLEQMTPESTLEMVREDPAYQSTVPQVAPTHVALEVTPSRSAVLTLSMPAKVLSASKQKKGKAKEKRKSSES